MQTWIKATLAVVVPAFGFLVLNDTVQGFYGPSRDLPLSYSVIEEEDAAPEEEEATVSEESALADEPTAEVADLADADMTPAEDTEALADDPAVAPEIAAETETAQAETDAAAEDDDTAPEATSEMADQSDAETEAETADGSSDTAEADQATDTAAADADTDPAATDTDAAATTVAALTEDEMQAGEAAARACASCHQLERDRNAVGPHLVGVGGRVIGSVEGFRYSQALQDLNATGAVWDAEALETWLADPSAFAEGTKMNFNVRDAEDRRLIAGWLTQRDQ